MKKYFCIVFLFLSFLSCQNSNHSDKNKIRVGYFPNLTHGQALIGIHKKLFHQHLSQNIIIEPYIFNAGPSLIEAIFAGKIDLAYIGPNPAINGYIKSKGKALKIIAGSASGGASLMIQNHINPLSMKDFEGKTIATPQIGNTQDIALKSYLKKLGLKTSTHGGLINIVAIPNPSIYELFKQNKIDAAWVPEPWATRLLIETHAKRFLDEREIHEDRQFPSTYLIASSQFLATKRHLAVQWCKAHIKITQWLQKNKTKLDYQFRDALIETTGKTFAPNVISQALAYLDFTYDFMKKYLYHSYQNAVLLGYIHPEENIDQIFEESIYKEAMTEINQEKS